MKPKSLPSRLFNRNLVASPGETLVSAGAAKYRRHVDCEEESMEDSDYSDSQPVADDSSQNEKSHREIHFAFVPEKYEPLVDDEARVMAEEEKKKRRKEKYKKVKKVSVHYLHFLKMIIIMNLHYMCILMV